MKLTNTIVVLITTVCCANAAKKQSWPAGFGGAKTEVYKTINDVNLRIHIFNPKGKSKKPRPAAVGKAAHPNSSNTNAATSPRAGWLQ